MDFTGQFLRMLGVLLAVCALAIFALRYLIPRFYGTKRWNKSEHFELISRFALDGRRLLYLVRAGEKYFILAAHDQGLSLITQLEASDIERPIHEKNK